MKRFELYKDSGISWLPQVPVHWEVKRLGTHFHSRVDANSDFAFQKAFKFNYGEIVPKNEAGNPEEYHDVYVKYSKVLKDDIMINGLNLNYDFVSQRVAMVPYAGIITSAYVVLRPYPTTYAPYYCYLLKAMDGMKLFHGMGTGIRLTLSFGEVKKQLVPVPSIDEQRRIVTYLDKVSASIDSLKSQKENELQTLNEYKQAIITSLVTKGLNPNSPMEYMETPLKTEHPSHWKRVRNMTFLIDQDEKVGNKSEDYQLLSLTTNGVILRDVESGKGKFPKDFESYKIVEPNEIVFCLFDIDETPRTVGLSMNHGMITGAYDVFKVREDIVNPKFVYAFYLAIDDIKALRPYYTGLRKVVKHNRFMQIGFPLPPLQEQNDIVHAIEEKTRLINSMVNSLKAEIERLSEYKQRLIFDVVTGQVNIQDEIV